MCEPRVVFAPDFEMNQRSKEAAELFDVLFEPDYLPWFVSDEASLYDLYAGDEAYVTDKIRTHYGVELQPTQLTMPLWRFLDILSKERKR